MMNDEEKSSVIEANNMMLLLMIDELSNKSPAEVDALCSAATYYKKMKRNHVLVDDDQILEKYYDMCYSFENKATFKEKLVYTIRRSWRKR